MAVVQHSSQKSKDQLSSSLNEYKKQVFSKEIFSFGSKTFVKCYSYNQTKRKSETGETFLFTKIHSKNFFIPPKRRFHRAIAPKDNTNSNFINSQSTQTEIGKPKVSSKITMTNAEESIFNKIFWFVLWAAIGILTIIISYEGHFTWDLNQNFKELTENVFGQTDAIAKINLTLNTFNNSDYSITMVFTGGTGVGKTFTSSIIRRNYPWISKKFISKLNDKEMLTFSSGTFSKFEPYLILIDDLQVDNIDQAINSVLLLKAKMRHTKVLFILIFTTHKNDEKEEILLKFKNTDLYVVHIPFVNLNRNAVEKCFRTETQKQGVFISEDDLEKLIKSKMKDIDVVKGPVGCKGVSEEVSFYKN